MLKKPGYVISQGSRYVPYEQLLLYPAVRRSLLFDCGSADSLFCACSDEGNLPVQIKENLSVVIPPTGHEYSCAAYRRSLQNILAKGPLYALSSASSPIPVSFRWGKGARNSRHLFRFDGFESLQKGGPISFTDLAASTAVIAYNKRLDRTDPTHVPGPEEIITDLFLEFSGQSLKNNARVPQELNIGNAMYDPFNKESYDVQFIVGRLLKSEAVRSGKTTVLFIETLRKNLSLNTEYPCRVSVETAEWSELLHSRDPLSPIYFKDSYVAALLVNRDIRVLGNGSYDSWGHSYYGDTEKHTFTIRKAQQLTVIQMSKYGMPCRVTGKEQEISEAYSGMGHACSKRLLPLPGCQNHIPAFVIENDLGPARAFFYKSDGIVTLDPSLYSVSYV